MARHAIKDPIAESNLFSRRALVSGVFVVLALCGLLVNMVKLQILDHDSYRTRSNDNRIRLLPIAPNRGLIYDRNGVLLAENRPYYSLELIPEEIDDLDDTVRRLSALLDIDEERQQSFYEQQKYARRFKRVALLNRLNEQEVARFAVNQHRFPGVYVEARLSRYYPYADALTHALGFVAKINRKDLDDLDKSGQLPNYKATRDIGKQGLEKYYEETLHGSVGFEEVEVNNRGRIIRTLNYQAPVAGQDLLLNLDINLQVLAHQALAGRRGAVVALDPKTGAVLALTSSPSYDPNLFVHGISSKDYSALLNSKDKPLINRATQGRYPPASTIKPHLGLLGLQEHLITPSTKIWDPGWYQPKNVNRRYRDWKRWGHGWVNLEGAIMHSCDTYYYDLAHKLGIDRISDFMTQFGFGEYTGIDIHEESRALMPSREWKRRRHREAWYLGDTISVGIGQSYWTATPLQLAVSTAIIASHGQHAVPRLLGSLQEDGQRKTLTPQLRPAVTVQDKHNWDVIIEAMAAVNHKLGGTAHKVFGDAPYRSAGKSGTAQVISLGEDEEYDEDKIKEKHRDNAMFIAFAPIDNPRIAVAVALENAGGGSSNAAPIVRKILDFYLQQEQP